MRRSSSTAKVVGHEEGRQQRRVAPEGGEQLVEDGRDMPVHLGPQAVVATEVVHH